jgi:large subunit ribosomal protein L18
MNIRYVGSSIQRRKNRTRMAVRSAQKPRLSVFRSGKYIYAQIIDDVKRHTLVTASSIEKECTLHSGSNCIAADWVGKKIAERALAAQIESVVFDRGGYKFHGRVKSLAEGARSVGLNF